MTEGILYIIFLTVYEVTLTFCIRGAVVSFRKGNYWSFGIYASLVFMVLIHMAKFIILA